MKKVLIFLITLILATSFLFSQRTLQIWAMGEEAKKLNIMAEKFVEQHPGIKVEIQEIPWSAAYDKLLTAIAGGTLPDVAQMGTTWMGTFGVLGVFEDLRPYLAKSDLSEEDFFEGSWNTVVVNGKVLGIPWYVDVRVMFYRTDILKEVGYDRAPQTWEELYDAAKKLAARGEGKYGLSLLYTGIFGNEFMPFVWQAGGKIFDEKGNVRVTDPEFIEAIEYYAKFFWEGLAPMGGSDLFQDFANGNVPIFFSGPWMVKMLDEVTPQIKGKWSVALMPKKVTRTSFVGGCNWIIFTSSKNKDLAWQFIEFMSKPENQLEWYKIIGDLPAVKETWKHPELSEDPVMKVFYEQLKDAKSPPTVPYWEEIATAISKRVEEVIYKKRTPGDAAKLLEKDIEKMVK